MTLPTHAPNVQDFHSSLIPLSEPLSEREARLWVTGTLEALRVEGTLEAYRMDKYSPAEAVSEDRAPVPAVLKVKVLSRGALEERYGQLCQIIWDAVQPTGVWVSLDIETDPVYWNA